MTDKYGKNSGHRHEINLDDILDRYETGKREVDELVSKGKAKYDEVKKEVNNIK